MKRFDNHSASYARAGGANHWRVVLMPFIVTLVLLALLAACSQTPVPDATESNAGEQPAAPNEQVEEQADEPAEEVEEPVEEPTAEEPAAEEPATEAEADNELIIAHGVDPRSLWANSSTAQQEINVSEQINEKLFEFTPDGDGFEPRLAVEWEQIDDTTLRVTLREGVTFTNGEPFNAESVKFSIEQMIQAPSYAAFVEPVAGAEVVDEYTVDITTKYPTLLHMPALAMGSFQYPPAYFAEVGPDEFGTAPIGTGPYVFVEHVRDSHVTLEANPDYWGGPPAFDRVTFRTIPEGAAKLAALEAGEVDFIIDVPLDAVDRIEGNPDLQLFSRPSNRMFYLTFSTLTDTPLQDPAVRRALQYAIDVDAIIEGLFGGRATRLDGQIVAPGFFGYVEGREPTPYDPDLARQMLADAGYPDGFEVTFKYPSGRYAQDKELGQVIAAQLAEVGVNTIQEVLEPGTFLTQLSEKQLNDMYLGGSLPPPDAHFMYSQFQSDFRYSYYVNPEFDALLAQGAQTADSAERQAIYEQIVALFDENPPFVPLYRGEEYYAARNGINGFEPRASQFLDLRAFTE